LLNWTEPRSAVLRCAGLRRTMLCLLCFAVLPCASLDFAVVCSAILDFTRLRFARFARLNCAMLRRTERRSAAPYSTRPALLDCAWLH